MESRKELHVISISGGKDSAALAIYLKEKYPEREFEYIFLDTGEELPETYIYLNKIEQTLGIEVQYLQPDYTFKELLENHHDYLPSPTERWCTRTMKLDKFLDFMEIHRDKLVYNYVGIRADENRKGLVPTEDHIITVMPFKDDNITLNDVKRILNDSGIGLPKYYEPIKDEEIGIEYYRSRSGCYFCFFMRQIEWVWLYEKHPDYFKKAMEFEKSGYSWIQGLPLKELIKPEKIRAIKESYKIMQERKEKQSVKNGTVLDEIKHLSKHDKKLEDEEKDEFCMMCML